jgi:hypothetical protein
MTTTTTTTTRMLTTTGPKSTTRVSTTVQTTTTTQTTPAAAEFDTLDDVYADFETEQPASTLTDTTSSTTPEMYKEVVEFFYQHPYELAATGIIIFLLVILFYIQKLNLEFVVVVLKTKIDSPKMSCCCCHCG